MPQGGAAVSQVPRFCAWKVQKDREVFMTASGPIIAERGSVVAIVVEDTFEAATAKLAKLLDKEPDDPR